MINEARRLLVKDCNFWKAKVEEEKKKWLEEKESMLNEKGEVIQEKEKLLQEKAELAAENARLKEELEVASAKSTSTEQITKAVEDAIQLKPHIKDILSTSLSNDVPKLVQTRLEVLLMKFELAAQTIAKSRKTTSGSGSVSKGEMRKTFGAEQSLAISEPISKPIAPQLKQLVRADTTDDFINRLSQGKLLRRAEEMKLLSSQQRLQPTVLKWSYFRVPKRLHQVYSSHLRST